MVCLGGCAPESGGGGEDNPDGAVDASGDDASQQDADLPQDSDGDGVVDSEDPCPNDPDQWTDADGDGVCDEVDDACADDPDGWTDADGDGVCDEQADKCPGDPQQWSDSDGDGRCDEVDDDCPTNPDGWDDTNGDGVCDGQDDSDGDGVSNGEEDVYGSDCVISSPTSADTDGDGIEDPEDPYPRDPFAEYILHRNDAGTIDIMLSNRDGTFEPPVPIGAEHGCTPDAPHNCPADTGYRYTGFVISDFDNNGSTDFLAIGDSDTSDPSNPRDLWWFWRSNDITSGGATVFFQRLVDDSLDVSLFRVLADFNNDTRVDLIYLDVTKPDYITEARFYSYENTGLVDSATCAYTTDPANPDGCLFIQRMAADLTSMASGLWVVSTARDSVDVDGDGFRDLAIYTMTSGGNVELPVYILTGDGAGTFDVPQSPMFSHNSGSCGSSPANSMLFSDFNGDDLGDIVIGLDDDGDPGSAWFYPGVITGGDFTFDFNACIEAFDINPGEESGSDRPGPSSSARNFDFDFDGNQDVMLGWNYPNTWAPPSHTILLMGNGDGTFAPPVTIRDFPDSGYGSRFAIPQRLCTWFPITSP
jgi:hypothetical protein